MSNVIHQLANADFTNYQYHEVYVPGDGVAKTIKGESVTVPTGSGIILPIGINTSGNTSGDIYLIGKKKPEFYRNADGTYPIK
jgi:hypothetical protein